VAEVCHLDGNLQNELLLRLPLLAPVDPRVLAHLGFEFGEIADKRRCMIGTIKSVRRAQPVV
jgi:hypothetical protein